MKKLLLICSLFLLGVSCGRDDELSTFKQTPFIEKTTTELTVAPESVVYDEATNQWLYKAGDPYTLANVKAAYHRLVSGKSRIETTRAQIDDLIQIGEPEITHYSLKFYPRTEAEQWKIMRIDNLQYSFYPFEYLPLTNEQVADLSVTRTSVPTLPFESRYSVTYTDLMTPEGPAEPQTIHLPTIYATWPVDNPLPIDLEYEIVEELYLPEYNGSENDSSVALLESEITPITPPWGDDPITPNPPVINNPKFKGRIMHYDDVLETNIPLQGIGISMRYGSNSVSAETDENGYFEIYDYITSIAIVTIHLYTDQFWIATYFEGATNNNSITYSESIGLADDFSYNPVIVNLPVLVEEVVLNNDAPYFETARAASFYFEGDHEIQTFIQENGLRISVCEDEGTSNSLGLFYCSYSNNNVHIEIYNYSDIYDDLTMGGAVLHELGHFTHYYERGGIFDNYNMENFIAESYACYVEDYLVRMYYAMYGKTFAPDELDQSLQYSFGTSDYTPLFIDLFDTFNQQHPNDNLSGFSHEAMRQIAQEVETWENLKEILRSYIDIYYSEYDLNTYLNYYDNWLNKN